ncbi:MAG: arsenate reductase ArsC [Bryobacteraceae bacterium]
MPRVLFLCTGNSARSQMAEGLLRHLGGGQFDVRSAGIRPTSVREEAIRAMAEIGIDISAQTSKSVEEFTSRAFDYVITVCDSARQSCPLFPGAVRMLHWSIEDPAAVEGGADLRLAAFRAARDELRHRIQAFHASTGPAQIRRP